jgi:hypothetical protein
VTLGGRRVSVRRPRVRATDGSGEVPVPAYELFSSTELLGEMAMTKMLAKLSTRRYRAGLEPVGTAVEAGGELDVEVGRLPPVRRRHRDGAGRAVGPRPDSGWTWWRSWSTACTSATTLCSRPGHRHRRDQAPPGPGGRLDRERHLGHRPAGRPERAGRGRRPAGPGRHRRRQGAGRGGAGRVRQPGHRPVPTAQDQERNIETARSPWAPRWPRRCAPPTAWTTPSAPRPLWKNWPVSSRSPTPVPPVRYEKGSPRPSPSCASACPHPGPHAALHQPGRVDDRDLPGPLHQRQALARRSRWPCAGARRG